MDARAAIAEQARLTRRRLTASILPVEAQHAIVLGSVNGKALADMIPKFETKDLALDPTKYPTK